MAEVTPDLALIVALNRLHRQSATLLEEVAMGVAAPAIDLPVGLREAYADLCTKYGDYVEWVRAENARRARAGKIR